MIRSAHDLDGIRRMQGWERSAAECMQAVSAGQMVHLVAETTNICNFDCEYCYTVQITTGVDHGHACVLPGELTLAERLALIDAAAALGAKTYDIVGAGEPLVDKSCMTQIEHAVSCGLQPVLFTNGSLLAGPRGRVTAERLWELGATVVVKHHGPAEVHDAIVRRRNAAQKRDEALATLMQLGFNACTPTRLGIDNIVYAATLPHIPDCLRWCRQNNVYLVCSSFILAGRTVKASERAATWDELRAVFAECRRIDAEEFGIYHTGMMPFIGSGSSCTQTLGLYVTIQGDVYEYVGKTSLLGNVRTEPLAAIWARHRKALLESFDGGCIPRKLFYASTGVPPKEIRKLFG